MVAAGFGGAWPILSRVPHVATPTGSCRPTATVPVGALRVLVLTPYPLRRAPSQRFRWEQYIEPLAARGIDLEPSSFLDDPGMDIVHRAGSWRAKAAATLSGSLRRVRDAVHARSYDLVLVHRESCPLGPAWVEPLLSSLRVPYAFEFDDAIYLPAASEANHRLARLKFPGKTASVVRRASLVVAGNDDLATWARAFNEDVVVVPTTIDTDAYHAPDRHQQPLCIGWSGSPSTIQHLAGIAPVLAELQRERNVRLRVIGDPRYAMSGARVEAVPWQAATEVHDLSEIDIGVMPLPDDEWARGKCGLKALQYMALGIPTVVSPVGVNRKIARDDAALMAETSEEWGAVLRALLDDPELRARVGQAGRRRVQLEYSVNAGLPLWEQALRRAASKPTG